MSTIEKNGGKIAAALCLASCVPMVATVYAVSTADGWHGDKYLENRQAVRGWKEIDGESYYFSEENARVDLNATREGTAAAVDASLSTQVETQVAEAIQEEVSVLYAAEEEDLQEEPELTTEEDQKVAQKETPAEPEKEAADKKAAAKEETAKEAPEAEAQTPAADEDGRLAMAEPSAEQGLSVKNGDVVQSPAPGLSGSSQNTTAPEQPVQAPAANRLATPGFMEQADASGNSYIQDQYGNIVSFEADGTPVTYDAQGVPYYYDEFGNPWPNGQAPEQNDWTADQTWTDSSWNDQTWTDSTWTDQTWSDEGWDDQNAWTTEDTWSQDSWQPAPEQTPAETPALPAGGPAYTLPGFVSTTDEAGVTLITDQYGNLVESDANGNPITYDASGIPYYYDMEGNPWPYGVPEMLETVQPSQVQTAPEASWNAPAEDLTGAETTETPALEQTPAEDPYAQYAQLNQAIVDAALPLVGTTNGWQCTEVAAAALAGAGVYDADSYWPGEFAEVYGEYTDTPQAGNLIYYNNGGNGLDHIAIYIGDGQAVHGNYQINGEGYTVVAGAEVEGAAVPQYIQVLR